MTDLSAALAVVVAIAFAHRVGWRPDPAGVGFGLGALVASGRLLWYSQDPSAGESVPEEVMVLIYVLVLGTVAGLLSWGGGLTPRIGSNPRWARQRTALAIVVIGGAHLALYLGDSSASHAVVLAGDTVGAVLLVSTYIAVFARTVESADRSYDNLTDELERARSRNRMHRTRMHEISSTIAGITSASELLRSTQAISEQRRIVLRDMIASELGRLERLVAPPEPAEPAATSATDLDATIGPLVVSQEARGHRVRWSPSGLRATATPDAVAEMVSVLLDNAVKHGRTEAEVTVTQNGDHVEIEVHDDGPGVDHSVRERIFDWGVRGPHSKGQGIGLHIARELAEVQGGYLRLCDTRWGGATFVLGLPHEPPELRSLPDVDTDDSSLQRDSA